MPVGVKDGALQLLCGEPVGARRAGRGVGARWASRSQLFIVPEVRLAAVRQAVFGRPMPPRLVRLFARVRGRRAGPALADRPRQAA